MATGVAPAAAQDREAAGERVIDAVATCRAEPDGARRLACYDRAADNLIVARQRNELTVLSPAEVKEGQRAVFGLPVSEQRLYGAKAAKIAPIETLDSTVTRLSRAGRDTFTVVLDDGSVWRTTERARYEPEVGNSVHIKRGAMGSYLGSFNRARSVRIERVR
ncbi:hypothetical protein [Sphingomonas corticis]|uniref:Uncharacterized protein n=1 Tax=Sphingomonas corticis TaxID=2722791 RepID=A0ABX1CPE5_9SPHN|nr:hypothetical protein [Sphingomonas corticis]NJR78701.1 hypothetical protein [Sphingomonas corticis]